MRNHIVRKSLGLIVLYAVIIIGIFVIQFRSDSIIRKTIHSMRVTFTEAENSTGNLSLKNQFQISYNGILFSADESSPLEFSENNRTKHAILRSFDEDELSCTLNFSNDIKITFELADSSEKSPLMISADFPSKISFVAINVRALSGYNFSEKKEKQAILEGKNSTYSLIAPRLQDSKLILLQNSKFARYSPYIKQTEFAIDSVAEFANASKAEWQNTIDSLNSAIISEFINKSQSDASFTVNLTEQTVVSYVAAMSHAGRYNEALNTVPESFIKGNKRTYLSAPFFGSLARVSPGLQIQLENYKNMTAQAIQSSSCNIFTTDSIADYILISGNDANVLKLLSMPATFTDNNFSLAQASGILKVYATLKLNDSENAEKLAPVLEPCIKKIADACKLDNNKIRLVENDTKLSVLAAVSIGDSFIQYGIASSNANIEKCGYLIVNSYISDLAGLDLRTMCEIYPLVVHDNSYYPHFEKVRVLNGNTVWAWTIAQSIKLTQDENSTLYIDIDFPLGLTHYVILAGINPFRRIQIYNMDFRTDPQFEIYNSSGYVYRSAMRALLLKSRHKSQHEIVKLFYRDVTQQEIPQEAEAETVSEE